MSARTYIHGIRSLRGLKNSLLTEKFIVNINKYNKLEIIPVTEFTIKGIVSKKRKDFINTFVKTAIDDLFDPMQKIYKSMDKLFLDLNLDSVSYFLPSNNIFFDSLLLSGEKTYNSIKNKAEEFSDLAEKARNEYIYYQEIYNICCIN